MTIARLHTLPIFRLSEASDSPGLNSLPVHHQIKGRQVKYWRRLLARKPSKWTTLYQLPLVVGSNGAPWEPACLWLLDRAQANPQKVASLATPAQGLKDYLIFLEELSLDWRDFSSVNKYGRPTYLYKTHLESLVNSGTLAPSTAKRRMSAVIQFYRYLINQPRMTFQPKNIPWEEKEVLITYVDATGRRQKLSVHSTDLSIRENNRDDPFSETIFDGGKLRPLPVEEQEALFLALKKLANTEYLLMHCISTFTGAREMTALTLRWGYFNAPPSSVTGWPLKLRCGPGTGIDTKNNATGVYLSIPMPLYEMLHIYAVSERAVSRREKSAKKSDPSNYLFLTNQGNPYYDSKDDLDSRRKSDEPMPISKRSSLSGQNLREFIIKRVIPEVRRTIPDFKYKFHDLRATFGMNWVDDTMRDNKSPKKFTWARDQLRKLMWHRSSETTDHYLKYRENAKAFDEAQQGWGKHLFKLINR